MRMGDADRQWQSIKRRPEELFEYHQPEPLARQGAWSLGYGGLTNVGEHREKDCKNKGCDKEGKFMKLALRILLR